MGRSGVVLGISIRCVGVCRNTNTGVDVGLDGECRELRIVDHFNGLGKLVSDHLRERGGEWRESGE